ncbi:MAG: PilZ domain-containing protein [Armatimonadetes bacterium]|nr:PilZ domain-containing protein [Armatimonadota bacterium]
MNSHYGIDQRRYIRYELLDYALVHVKGAANPIRAIIVDIGLGGLQLRSRDPIPVGQIVEIRMGNVENEPVAIRGEVRHSQQVPASDLVASGIRFVPSNHEERRAVAEYVHQVFQRQADLLTG